MDDYRRLDDLGILGDLGGLGVLGVLGILDFPGILLSNKKEKSRHHDDFFSKVLVCFFKVQKRLCCFDFECKGTAFF